MITDGDSSSATPRTLLQNFQNAPRTIHRPSRQLPRRPSPALQPVPSSTRRRSRRRSRRQSLAEKTPKTLITNFLSQERTIHQPSCQLRRRSQRFPLHSPDESNDADEEETENADSTDGEEELGDRGVATSSKKRKSLEDVIENLHVESSQRSRRSSTKSIPANDGTASNLDTRQNLHSTTTFTDVSISDMQGNQQTDKTSQSTELSTTETFTNVTDINQSRKSDNLLRSSSKRTGDLDPKINKTPKNVRRSSTKIVEVSDTYQSPQTNKTRLGVQSSSPTKDSQNSRREKIDNDKTQIPRPQLRRSSIKIRSEVDKVSIDSRTKSPDRETRSIVRRRSMVTFSDATEVHERSTNESGESPNVDSEETNREISQTNQERQEINAGDVSADESPERQETIKRVNQSFQNFSTHKPGENVVKNQSVKNSDDGVAPEDTSNEVDNERSESSGMSSQTLSTSKRRSQSHIPNNTTSSVPADLGRSDTGISQSPKQKHLDSDVSSSRRRSQSQDASSSKSTVYVQTELERSDTTLGEYSFNRPTGQNVADHNESADNENSLDESVSADTGRKSIKTQTRNSRPASESPLRRSPRKSVANELDSVRHSMQKSPPLPSAANRTGKEFDRSLSSTSKQFSTSPRCDVESISPSKKIQSNDMSLDKSPNRRSRSSRHTSVEESPTRFSPCKIQQSTEKSQNRSETRNKSNLVENSPKRRSTIAHVRSLDRTDAENTSVKSQNRSATKSQTKSVNKSPTRRLTVTNQSDIGSSKSTVDHSARETNSRPATPTDDEPNLDRSPLRRSPRRSTISNKSRIQSTEKTQSVKQYKHHQSTPNETQKERNPKIDEAGQSVQRRRSIFHHERFISPIHFQRFGTPTSAPQKTPSPKLDRRSRMLNGEDRRSMWFDDGLEQESSNTATRSGSSPGKRASLRNLGTAMSPISAKKSRLDELRNETATQTSFQNRTSTPKKADSGNKTQESISSKSRTSSDVRSNTTVSSRAKSTTNKSFLRSENKQVDKTNRSDNIQDEYQDDISSQDSPADVVLPNVRHNQTPTSKSTKQTSKTLSIPSQNVTRSAGKDQLMLLMSNDGQVNATFTKSDKSTNQSIDKLSTSKSKRKLSTSFTASSTEHENQTVTNEIDTEGRSPTSKRQKQMEPQIEQKSQLSETSPEKSTTDAGIVQTRTSPRKQSSQSLNDASITPNDIHLYFSQTIDMTPSDKILTGTNLTENPKHTSTPKSTRKKTAKKLSDAKIPLNLSTNESVNRSASTKRRLIENTSMNLTNHKSTTNTTMPSNKTITDYFTKKTTPQKENSHNLGSVGSPSPKRIFVSNNLSPLRRNTPQNLSPSPERSHSPRDSANDVSVYDFNDDDGDDDNVDTANPQTKNQRHPSPKSHQAATQVTKPKGAQRRAVKNLNLPPRMAQAYTKQLFSHFAGTTKVSKTVLDQVQLAGDKFWDNLIANLTAYGLHRKSKTVGQEDIQLLMYRQHLTSEKRSMYSLVEKYLPLEMRNEIIPTVSSGNVIKPKPKLKHRNF